VGASWPEKLTAPVRTCLDAALRRTEFTCPQAGQATEARAVLAFGEG
jgi:hypothetical protein